MSITKGEIMDKKDLHYILSGLLIGAGIYALLDFVKHSILGQERPTITASIKSNFKQVKRDFDSAGDKISGNLS